MKKIVAIGDSITWGFPYGEKVSWVAELKKNYPAINWINMGINGDTYEGILFRLEQDVVSQQADGCIVTAGLNDVFIGYGLNEIKDIVQRITSRLKNSGIRIILGIPVDVKSEPAFNNRAKEVQDWLLSYATENQLAIIDFRGLALDDYADEVHPNDRGYAKMGRMAVEAIKEILR